MYVYLYTCMPSQEWHAALSKHQRPHRVNSSEQFRRNALHKESLGTGASD